MAKPASSIVRSNPRFKPQPTVLVICEDLKSGKTYLQDANQYFRANFHIEITHCGYTDPKGIVTEALKRSKKYDLVICAIRAPRVLADAVSCSNMNPSTRLYELIDLMEEMSKPKPIDS